MFWPENTTIKPALQKLKKSIMQCKENLHCISFNFCGAGLMMVFSGRNMWSFLNKNVVVFDRTINTCSKFINTAGYPL